MSAASQNDQNYWKAYCSVIQKKLQPNLGKHSALFFCTESVRGITAADFIPEDITNNQTYFMGNFLLDASNMFYVPSKSDGYLKALQTYLSYVDLGTDKGNPALLAQYVDAQKNAIAAQTGVTNAQNKAFADYNNAKTMGLTGNLNFPAWAVSNAPAMQNAQTQFQAANATLKTLVQQINGPLAPQYSADIDKINAAIYGITPTPGINMRCSIRDINNLGDMYAQSLAGTTPTVPVTPDADIFYRAAFSIQGYKDQLKTWYMNQQKYIASPQKEPVSLDAGSTKSVSDFGFTDTDASGSFSWCPFISFAADYHSSENRQSLDVSNTQYKIDLALTYGDIQAFDILPGTWDIGNPSSTYKKLQSSAPKAAKSLVRPLQMLCGTAIGLEVSFSGGAESAFDSLVSQYTSVSGGVRIFGLDIGLDGNQVSTDTKTTHLGSWDKGSSKFTVKPTPQAGVCNLLGVLGEKIVV